MKRNYLIAALSLIVILSFALLIWAEEDGPADDMEILKEAVRANKKLVITTNMELTASEAEKFWPVYNEYQSQLEKLFEQRKALVEKYAENYETMTDDIAIELLDTHFSIEAQRLSLQSVFVPKFKKVLPPIKVVRYFQCENKIAATVFFEVAAQIPLIK
ncbi:MAG: hypothetical protein ACYTFM_05550 [Planctomycetota bacterium]|jgi:DNA-binding protein H-NS